MLGIVYFVGDEPDIVLGVVAVGIYAVDTRSVLRLAPAPRLDAHGLARQSALAVLATPEFLEEVLVYLHAQVSTSLVSAYRIYFTVPEIIRITVGGDIFLVAAVNAAPIRLAKTTRIGFARTFQELIQGLVLSTRPTKACAGRQ